MFLSNARRVSGVALLLVLVLAATPGRAPAEEVTDVDVTRAVENEFFISDAVDANRIDVTTLNGVVTLTGTVDNLLARKRAAQVAEHIVGVRAIVNRIQVVPWVQPTDDELETSVADALWRDPVTEAYEVEVSAEEGRVTLAGTVDSWQEKQLCARVAESVPGVRSVRSDIAVEYDQPRLDGEIARDVEARLANDLLVDDYLIEVTVRDSEVELAGTVGSLAEKNRAIADAWVIGVESVSADDLTIRWWARDEMRRTEDFATRPDEEIEAAVKDAYFYDPRVAAFNPEVQVEDGTVVLTGVVDNLLAKRAAEQDAANVVGVRTVRSYLKVRPEAVPADDVLENRVADALLLDPYVERFDIDINAVDGVVYLRGDVNTSFERNAAEWAAQKVNGVVDVVNNIDYEHTWTWMPDREIRDNVEEQLYWSPYVDSGQIEVTVEDGVATLSGLVDTWSERRTAEANAFEAGAKDVDNRLTVTLHRYGPHFWYWPRH